MNMLKTRLIPVLLYKDGFIVKSRNFKNHQIVGDPVSQVARYNEWNIDELIYLNISDKNQKTNHLNYKVNSSTSGGKKILPDENLDIENFIKILSKKCFMPLTYGGSINNIEVARKILKNGADKISINTAAFKNKQMVIDCVKNFGGQSVVISIDYKKINSDHIVCIENGKEVTNTKVEDWANEVEKLGVGEILLNSIDNDGRNNGYDIEFKSKIIKQSNIPITICGGVGNFQHFVEGFNQAKPHAMAAANIFQFTEDSYQNAKRFCKSKNLNVR